MHAFHSRARDLSVHEGVLFLGMRAVVVALALRHRVLKMHEGHSGCTRMKLIARKYVYWQGINRDIEEQVKNCSACQDAAKCLPGMKRRHGQNPIVHGRESTSILPNPWKD